MTVRIITGHVLEALAGMTAESVHMVVTSPPYWGLRDYGVEPQVWSDGWRGSLGLEPSPMVYVAHLVEVFREVRRVLRRDGTLWINLGDSYATGAGKAKKAGGGAQGDYWNGHRGSRGGSSKQRHTGSAVGPACQPNRMPLPGLKPKDLIGMPWRVAFALQDDGWYLRRDIIWSKPNPMPESVTDRPTAAHEYLFLLSKSARYFYDGEAIKEPTVSLDVEHPSYRPNSAAIAREGRKEFSAKHPVSARSYDLAGRNRRSVWTIATAPFADAHFATFPPALVEPCILAGMSAKGVCPRCGAPWDRVLKRTKDWRENACTAEQSYPAGSGNRRLRPSNSGMSTSEYALLGWRPGCSCDAGAPVPAAVLDPFLGSGTTALVADRLGRDCIGIELNPEYAAMARRRIEADGGMFARLAAE